MMNTHYQQCNLFNPLSSIPNMNFNSRLSRTKCTPEISNHATTEGGKKERKKSKAYFRQSCFLPMIVHQKYPPNQGIEQFRKYLQLPLLSWVTER
ncbi:hypothetical protein CEXT_788921 [Caerostris extrusa]|uniref:Uncharacterized protein n=1 Tax=Caerostris extrusa TaxID=172846 RepID=A0AAV4MXX2_CAEEX|nr:hypothetical protein CEXT_788921 [Caerostris extrusa]